MGHEEGGLPEEERSRKTDGDHQDQEMPTLHKRCVVGVPVISPADPLC